jgi:hypothetical protein
MKHDEGCGVVLSRGEQVVLARAGSVLKHSPRPLLGRNDDVRASRVIVGIRQMAFKSSRAKIAYGEEREGGELHAEVGLESWKNGRTGRGWRKRTGFKVEDSWEAQLTPYRPASQFTQGTARERGPMTGNHAARCISTSSWRMG